VIALEIISAVFFSLLFLILFIFGVWESIENYKRNKKLKKNLPTQYKMVIQNKICTQNQPFRVDDKNYIICNFVCDGNCQLINKTI
jgi:hypothetical protein